MEKKTINVEVSREFASALDAISKEMDTGVNEIIVAAVIGNYGLQYLPDYAENDLCNGKFEARYEK